MTPKLHIILFNKRIPSFHFFGVLGYVLGNVYVVLIARHLRLEPAIVLLMGLIGAAIFFLLAFAAKRIAKKEVIVYYHHEIAIILFCALALYFLDRPILSYLDIAILGIGIFLCFGRIGCYSVGCCHGRPHKHGVKYGQEHVSAGFTGYYKDVPLLPVQLIESACVFLIIIICSIVLLNRARPGTVLVCYTAIYGLMRFIIEFFRGDPGRPVLLGISEAQWTTLLLVSVGLLLSMRGYLPLYNWHWIILLLLLAISAFIVFVRRSANDYILLSPKHIAQIANALKERQKAANKVAFSKNIPLHVSTTNQGLSISSGCHQVDSYQVHHYTLSANATLKLNVELVTKIANTICLIKKHPGQFELIENQNSIYHIIIREERLAQKIIN